jgi:hypothetical protein
MLAARAGPMAPLVRVQSGPMGDERLARGLACNLEVTSDDSRGAPGA